MATGFLLINLKTQERAKRKLFTWIFCWDLKLNVSSTGSLLGFPSKARLLHLLATILDEPTWPCSFQPWFISISYFYRCHQSLCAVLMDVSMNHQSSDCRTAPDTTASSPPDPPSQLQSSPSRTGSRISSHVIISSHFNIPGGKQALYEVLLMAQEDFSWDKPWPQTLSRRNVLWPTMSVLTKCHYTNHHYYYYLNFPSLVLVVIDVPVSTWVILGVGAGFESEDAISALWLTIQSTGHTAQSWVGRTARQLPWLPADAREWMNCSLDVSSDNIIQITSQITWK